MQQQIEKQLQGMLNKTYKYGLRIITLTGYEINEEKQRVYLHTNEKERHYDRPFDGIFGFLKELEETDLSPVVRSDNVPEVLMSTAKDLGGQLKGVLMDTIEKVQADKGYIAQATVVNNSINSLINLTKLQLQLFNSANKMKNQ